MEVMTKTRIKLWQMLDFVKLLFSAEGWEIYGKGVLFWVEAFRCMQAFIEQFIDRHHYLSYDSAIYRMITLKPKVKCGWGIKIIWGS